jgi:L-asparaginase II
MLELSRGISTEPEKTIESIHFGAIAVVDARGKLLASFADPYTISFLRSTAKPFQALPFYEQGGKEFYCLTPREISLTCASHSGSAEHVSIVESIQLKTGLKESDLLCGIQPPRHEPTAELLRAQSKNATQNFHMCSGKHSGMLAFSRMLDQPTQNYLDISHAVQKAILQVIADMFQLPLGEIHIGIDGCSAPTFAVPLYNTALAFARLCDPVTGSFQSENRIQACELITSSMISHPDMVAGPGEFDTCLMEIGSGRFLSKSGAEGYLGLGLLPGALAPNSCGIGIAIKISDGDLRGRAIPSVALEVLRQLKALTKSDLEALQQFGPVTPILNWRKLVVGESKPNFTLQFAG